MMSLLNASKGHNSIKNVGRVTVLALCILSDYALYLTKFFVKISQRLSEFLSRQDFQTKCFKGA